MATNSGKTITIKIIGEKGGTAGDNGGKQLSGGNGGTQTQPINSEELLSKSSGDTSNGSVKKMLYLQAKNQAINIATSAASYSLNRYFSVKEDYLSENVYNEISSKFSVVKSAYSGGKKGAQLGGSIGGGWGALIGAVVGTVWGGATNALQKHIDYQKKMSGYYQQLNATNAQTEFQAKRLGLSNEGQNTIN